MPKRKRQTKKKLAGNSRLKDATRWLGSQNLPKNLVEAYSKRYGINTNLASDELMEIGYYDDILIQAYEKEGVKWKYIVEPLSGEMLVVPEDIEEYEIYKYHPFF